MVRAASLLVPLLIPLTIVGLPGCDRSRGDTGEDLAAGATSTRPMPRPTAGAAGPAAGASTVDQFDTTTAEERAAAAAAPAIAAPHLGQTVATLGDPADPGFWLETPLVNSVRPGRVTSVATGQSVRVELRPIDGEPGSGSRISLPALRLLGAGITGLHQLDVFAG